MEHEQIFQKAVAAKNNTTPDMPSVDVNKTIQDHYQVPTPFTYTRAQLWDMEIRKAHDPEKYIYQVVKPGSVSLYNEKWESDHIQRFIRISDQKLWKDPDTYGTIIEDVCLDHSSMRAFFIGIKEFTAPDGRNIEATDKQPTFHVEHSVEGPEERPVNIWRIVHLTDQPDAELEAIFRGMAKVPYLRNYNEVYIRDVLGHDIVRK